MNLHCVWWVLHAVSCFRPHAPASHMVLNSDHLNMPESSGNSERLRYVRFELICGISSLRYIWLCVMQPNIFGCVWCSHCILLLFYIILDQTLSEHGPLEVDGAGLIYTSWVSRSIFLITGKASCVCACSMSQVYPCDSVLCVPLVIIELFCLCFASSTQLVLSCPPSPLIFANVSTWKGPWCQRTVWSSNNSS